LISNYNDFDETSVTIKSSFFIGSYVSSKQKVFCLNECIKISSSCEYVSL